MAKSDRKKKKYTLPMVIFDITLVWLVLISFWLIFTKPIKTTGDEQAPKIEMTSSNNMYDNEQNKTK